MTKLFTILATAAFLLSSFLGPKTQASSQSDPDILWRGDAETGDLSQWEVRAPSQISVVNSPVGQGSYAYKFVLPANFVSQGGKEAAWLSSKPFHSEVNGEEKYYGWQVFIPTDYPTNSAWALVVQWKGEGTGSPPVALGYRNNTWSVNNNPTAGTGNNVQLANFPATKGRWEKFVYHIKWSPDPSVGFVEVWYNGALVLRKKHVSTIHLSGGNPVPNYINIGMYRDPSINDTVTLYHDGFIVGKTYASVTGDSPPVTSVPPTNTNIAPPTPTRTPTLTRTSTATRTALPPTVTFTPVSATPSVTPTPFSPPSPTATVPPACLPVTVGDQLVGYYCP